MTKVPAGSGSGPSMFVDAVARRAARGRLPLPVAPLDEDLDDPAVELAMQLALDRLLALVEPARVARRRRRA